MKRNTGVASIATFLLKYLAGKVTSIFKSTIPPLATNVSGVTEYVISPARFFILFNEEQDTVINPDKATTATKPNVFFILVLIFIVILKLVHFLFHKTNV